MHNISCKSLLQNMGLSDLGSDQRHCPATCWEDHKGFLSMTRHIKWGHTPHSVRSNIYITPYTTVCSVGVFPASLALLIAARKCLLLGCRMKTPQSLRLSKKCTISSSLFSTCALWSWLFNFSWPESLYWAETDLILLLPVSLQYVLRL